MYQSKVFGKSPSFYKNGISQSKRLKMKNSVRTLFPLTLTLRKQGDHTFFSFLTILTEKRPFCKKTDNYHNLVYPMSQWGQNYPKLLIFLLINY